MRIFTYADTARCAYSSRQARVHDNPDTLTRSPVLRTTANPTLSGEFVVRRNPKTNVLEAIDENGQIVKL